MGIPHPCTASACLRSRILYWEWVPAVQFSKLRDTEEATSNSGVFPTFTSVISVPLGNRSTMNDIWNVSVLCLCLRFSAHVTSRQALHILIWTSQWATSAAYGPSLFAAGRRNRGPPQPRCLVAVTFEQVPWISHGAPFLVPHLQDHPQSVGKGSCLTPTLSASPPHWFYLRSAPQDRRASATMGSCLPRPPPPTARHIVVLHPCWRLDHSHSGENPGFLFGSGSLPVTPPCSTNSLLIQNRTEGERDRCPCVVPQ